jgi:hypothetical protein
MLGPLEREVGHLAFDDPGVAAGPTWWLTGPGDLAQQPVQPKGSCAGFHWPR